MVPFILSFSFLEPHIQQLKHGYEMQGMYNIYIIYIPNPF